MNKFLLPLVLALLVSACAKPTSTDSDVSHDVRATAKTVKHSLATVLAAQPEDVRARYVYRNPQDTLEFFGLDPGTAVIEALPGTGWYTKILLDYIGADGHLIGADYAMAMWPLFGFFPDEFIEAKKTWTTDWTAEAEEWRGDDDAPVSAFVFGSMPAKYEGKADAVLFIRALHNLNRFESKGGFLSAALSDAHKALKPGGIVGVVQHRSPDSFPDEWADGSRGYLKKDALIARIEAAGFEFLGSSEINVNPKDQPTEEDIVWRLPPTYFTSRENPELHAKMEAIGESNRMTLKFRKP